MYRFVNFKGFADATLDLRTPVTVLIGRNGAGKSNALEAIMLLAGLLGGYSLADISDQGGGGKVQVRGGIRGCFRDTEQEFTLGFAVQPEIDYELAVHLPKQRVSRPSVGREILRSYGQTLFESARRGAELLRVSYSAKDWHKPKQVNLPDYGPAIARMGLLQPGTVSEELAENGGILLHAASRVFAFDPQPRAMRAFAEQHDTVLRSTGDNIAAVLYGLSRGKPAERESLALIAETLKSLPEEPIDGIGFIPVAKTTQVGLGLLTPAGKLIPAQVMSDGTLRALAVVTAIETAPAGATVLVEEFDNGLHPSRVRDLLEFCWHRASQRMVRVLVTTHNTALLDGLTLEQRKGVVVCHWDANEMASKLTPLDELRDYIRVVTAGSLGEAARDGIVDAAAQSRTPEQDAAEVERHLTWFKEFEQEAGK